MVTSITGGKDKLREDFDFSEGRFLAFTQGGLSDNWDIKEPHNKFKDHVRNAKIHKVLIHKYVDTPYSVWVDGNISFNVPVTQLVEQLLGDGDMWAMTHFFSKDAYHESIMCSGLDNEPQMVFDQIERYRIEGLPEGHTFYECNVLIRKNSDKVNMFNSLWWAEISAGSRRDQVAFPYCLWKMGNIDMRTSEGNVRTHSYFSYKGHKR